MGVVLDRSSLTLAQQNEYVRKQFDPLPADLQKWYEDTCKKIFKAFGYDEIELDGEEQLGKGFLVKDTFTLKWRDMGAICFFADKPGYELPNLSAAVSNNYIQLVCDYVNQVRAAARNQKIVEEVGAVDPKNRLPPTDNHLSCVMIPDQIFNQIEQSSILGLRSRSEAITNILNERNLNGPNFMNLDYLFIPYLETETHYILIGIAPKQQYIFAVDTANEQWPIDDYPVQSLYAMLLQLLPGASEDDKEKHATANWNVFGQWSRRTKKEDGSPNCAQQKDRYNCGMFTITNAFCLAFGFDLLCYRQQDLDFGKRPRVAAEFNNNGFSGDFAYDMFDLPTGPADRVGLAQPAAAGDDDNTEVAYGFQTRIQKGILKRKFPGDADNSRIFSALEALAYEQQLPAASKPQPRTPDTYPPQFNSKVFQQGGFIYATPASINYDPSRGYSIEELKHACQRFPLEGWEKWCNEPKDPFLKWMLNEMGAFMSLARGDPLKPMIGLARGFEKWKAEQDAKSRRKQPWRKCKK
jgi:hypothetical protein